MATHLRRPRTLAANPLRRLVVARARSRARAQAAELWPVVRAAAADGGLDLEDGELEQVGGDRSSGVAVVRSASGRRAVVRFASRPDAVAGLARADDAIARVRSAAPALADLVPDILLGGTVGPVAWRLETFLPGRPASAFVRQPETHARVVGRIGVVLGRLREAIGTERRLTRDEVAARIERDRPTVDGLGVGDLRLDPVAAALDGVTTPVGLIHGDLWAGNVLVDSAGVEVCGIVDWDSAADDEPAFHDLLHLLLTARRRANREPLGRAIARALDRDEWEAWERRLLDEIGLTASAGGRARDVTRAAVILYWLREVRSNLTRHPSLAADRGWVRDNVATVVRWV